MYILAYLILDKYLITINIYTYFIYVYLFIFNIYYV